MKKQAVALGVGWFAIQTVWTAYNAFMPLFYERFTASFFLIGLLMTLDNVAALTLQPFWGARSDLTRSALGRRKPYLIVGMPLAALAVFALPYFANATLAALVGAAIVLNICMTIFRAPLLALFSDLFSSGVRAQISGFTDLLAGVGAIVMLLVGGRLFDRDHHLPFAMAAGFLLIAALALYFGIREPALEEHATGSAAGDLPSSIPGAVRTLFRLPEKSPLIFLAGVFFIWTAWNGFESFWTLFATTALGMSAGDAAGIVAVLALSYLVGAVPAGFAAARFGRQRTMMAGLLLLVPCYLLGAFNRSMLVYGILFGIIGVVWSLVLVNGVILFQEFASPRQVGLFSGIYAIGTAAAQILGPPTYGALMSLFGPYALWFASLGAVIVGAAFISRVREGRVYAPEPTQGAVKAVIT